jgi:hexosaminidase
MMKQFICWLIIATSFASKAQDINIIPQPVSVDVQKGSFTISSQTQIVIPDASLRSTADFFNNYLNKVYGFKLSITSKPRVLNTIILTGNRDKPIGTGYYGLVVSNDHISVNGETNDGVFYGVQTLIQLLPIKNLKTKTQNLKIPQLTISDHPRFAYRGMHLDCARHFWPVSFIKQYIDYLALHKMNYFHWHLTDDQGWRIEIKKYPGLTKTGAWRNGTIIGRYPGKGNDEIPYGGFYTQEQIKEIVKYAANRYITVVPEIEMPGHSSAAIASYPFLSCFPNEPTKIPANMISKRSVAEQSNGKIKLVQETW